MALGYGIDDMNADVERMREVNCTISANDSPSAADIDAKTADLGANWKPTGYYSADEINAMVGQIRQAGAMAAAQVLAAPKSTSDAGTVISQAIDYLNRNEERSQSYLQAAQQAQQQGLRLVYAPGFKTYVTNSMVNISQAYVTAAALNCRTSWFDTAANVITDIWKLAKSIGSLTLAAGETAVKAAEGIVQMLKNIMPYVPWILVGAGAIWVGFKVYPYARPAIASWRNMHVFKHNQE